MFILLIFFKIIVDIQIYPNNISEDYMGIFRIK